jgi:hypothetical protein
MKIQYDVAEGIIVRCARVRVNGYLQSHNTVELTPTVYISSDCPVSLGALYNIHLNLTIKNATIRGSIFLVL